MHSDSLAVAQADRAFGQLRDVRIVGHEDERRAGAAIQLEHDLDDSAARFRIEIAGRLIGKKNLRPIDESAGERDALLFAAGKLRRVMIDAFASPTRRSKSSPSARAVRSPRSSIGTVTFSSAVSVGMSWKF